MDCRRERLHIAGIAGSVEKRKPRKKCCYFVQHDLRKPFGKGKNKNHMKTNAQTGTNQPTRSRNGRCSNRRLCLSWLATLVLATSGTATAATVTVHVGTGGLFFDPDSVTISAGDTVEWIWDDASKGHSATSGANGRSDGLFDSGTHPAPFTFSFTFPNTGTFPYFCAPHYSMGMVGQVIVTAATSSPTPTPSATPVPSATPTPGSTPPPPTVLANISTRLLVETGDNVLIGGFIITGTQPKRVIIRALGPSLSAFVPGALADPILELHGPGAFTTITNDNWRSDQEAEIIATGIPPSNDLESAIVATLPANGSAYTAIVSGVNNGTGIGLIEAYDLDHTVDSKLANISTRGLVQTGDNVLIAGTIVLGQTAQRVIVRAIGPSLNIPGKLADPTLELRDGNGALLAANDNWRSDQEAEIIATGIPPTNDLESAIVETLPASGASYTAVVRGVGGSTGVAVVEIYALN
jgi:plastocyanin